MSLIFYQHDLIIENRKQEHFFKKQTHIQNPGLLFKISWSIQTHLEENPCPNPF